MPFKNEVAVRQVDPKNFPKTWELTADLVYQGRDELLTVPATTRTDFASVPWFFAWLIPRSGRYTPAAVLHDFLYDRVEAGTFSRCDADGIFRRAMRELGVGLLRRWAMWAAVRATHGPFQCGWRQSSRMALALILPLLLAIVGGSVVVPLLFAVWLIDMAVYGALRLAGRPANRPEFFWRA